MCIAELLLVIGLTVGAAIVRLKIPMQYDRPHIDNGQLMSCIRGILDYGRVPTFTVIEPASYYVLAGAATLFGYSYRIAVDCISIFGALTIPMVYLIARCVYGIRTAFLSAAALAVSYWHISMGRAMFHDVMSLFFAILALGVAVYWLSKPNWIDAALCGLAFAIATESRLSSLAYMFTVVLPWVGIVVTQKPLRRTMCLQLALVLLIPALSWFAYNMSYYAVAVTPPALAVSSWQWVASGLTYACTEVFKWYQIPGSATFNPSGWFLPQFLYHELGAIWLAGIALSLVLSLLLGLRARNWGYLRWDCALVVACLVLAVLSYRAVFQNRSYIVFHNQCKTQLVVLPVYILLLGSLADKAVRLTRRKSCQIAGFGAALLLWCIPAGYMARETFHALAHSEPVYISQYRWPQDRDALVAVKGTKTWYNGSLVNVPAKEEFFSDFQRAAAVVSALPVATVANPDFEMLMPAYARRGRIDGPHHLNWLRVESDSEGFAPLCYMMDASVRPKWLRPELYRQFSVGGQVVGVAKTALAEGGFTETAPALDNLTSYPARYAGDLPFRFLGGRIDPPPHFPGTSIGVTCYWRVDKAPAEDLLFQWQLTNDDGSLAAIGPASPYHSWYPTFLWQPNDVIEERFDVPLRTPFVLRAYSLRLLIAPASNDSGAPLDVESALAAIEFPDILPARPQGRPANMSIRETLTLQSLQLDERQLPSGKRVTVTLAAKALRDVPKGGRFRVSLVAQEGKKFNWETSLANEYYSSTRFLSDIFPWEPDHYVHGVLHDVTVDGRPIAVGEDLYSKGVTIVPANRSAPSQAVYQCAGFDVFRADCGMSNRVVGKGSAAFFLSGLHADRSWKDLLKTGPLSWEVARVDVPISSLDWLQLACTDAGNSLPFDHATWADARLMKARHAVILKKDDEVVIEAPFNIPPDISSASLQIEIDCYDLGVK